MKTNYFVCIAYALRLTSGLKSLRSSILFTHIVIHLHLNKFLTLKLATGSNIQLKPIAYQASLSKNVNIIEFKRT